METPRAKLSPQTATHGQGGVPVARGLAWLYLAGLVCLWGATRGVAERSEVTTLLLYIPQLLYGLPLPLLLGVAAYRKDASALLALGLGAGWIAGPLMGLCLPVGRPPPPDGAPRLRVLTYNVRLFHFGSRAVADEIRAARPDVVLLVEAHRLYRAPEGAEPLLEALPGYAIERYGEFLLLSRFPLEPSPERPDAPHAICRDVRAPFGRFRVIGAHLSHDRVTAHASAKIRGLLRRRAGSQRSTHAAERGYEVDRLIEMGGAPDTPALLMGDFNMPPAGDHYRRLSRRFQDVYRDAGFGWGYTYPSRLPVLRIDYVFASRHWVPLSCRAGGRIASDHRPVIAELAYRDAGGV